MDIDKVKVFRGELLHCLADPADVGDKSSYEYFQDGVMIVRSGLVEAVGSAPEMLTKLPADASVIHYTNSLIVPGFIDCHLHYPQTEIIAAYGQQLLEWPEMYAFPTENEFIDEKKASKKAEFFFDELMREGTYPSISKNSDLFELGGEMTC